jgi:hypothetical protein
MMLNELVKRLGGGGKADRRGADRIRKRFPIAWLKDGQLISGLGLEISEKGVLFASREAPAAGQLDVAIDIGPRRVKARLKVARQGTMSRDGAEWVLIAGVFEAIAADDWDAVVRFCKNRSDPTNKGAEELAAMAGQDDDAYRLLPLRVQQRVVTVLMQSGRLAPGSDPKNPLLRMSYEGKTTSGKHRLAVHSRRSQDGEVLQFDSVLTVDDAGNVVLER